MSDLEQTIQHSNQEILSYLGKLVNPRHDIRSTEVFRILRRVFIPTSCLAPLETTAKSVGTLLSSLSRNQNLERTRTNQDFTLRVIEKFIEKIRYAMETEEISPSNPAAVNDLRKLADAAIQVNASIYYASENSSPGYCPLCWRHPAPGKRTQYCNLHFPDSFYDQQSNKYHYDITEYRAAARLLDRVSNILEIQDSNPYAPKKTRKKRLYDRTWGILKIETRKAFPWSSQSGKAWKDIIDTEKELLAEIIQSKDLGKRLPDWHSWGEGNSWRQAAKNITLFTSGVPNVAKRIPITPPTKDETLQIWLNRLSSFMSEQQEFDHFIKPSEIMGLIHRFGVYQHMLELTPKSRSTTPNLRDREECILMRNKGASYAEIGRKLGKSRQWAQQTYKKHAH